MERRIETSELGNIRCPFKVVKELRETYFEPCIGKKCMAWLVTDTRIEREDHSGAKETMFDIGCRRGQEVKRKGPPGSLGIFYLEERGTCVKLYPQK